MQGLLGMQGAMDAGEWRACSDNAQVAANFLRCHPVVAEVRYPGLTRDPDYREASSTLRGGFGPLVRMRLAPARIPATAPTETGWLELDARKGPSDARELVLILEDRLRHSLVG